MNKNYSKKDKSVKYDYEKVMNEEMTYNVHEINFKKFLEDDNIYRIFFSGRYGAGKTTFLRKFFKKHNDEYIVFHLFPIYYQILSTENIIDYIKLDILVELIEKKKLIKQQKLNKKQGLIQKLIQKLKLTITHKEQDKEILSVLSFLIISIVGIKALDVLGILEPFIKLGKFSGEIDIAYKLMNKLKKRKGIIPEFFHKYKKRTDEILGTDPISVFIKKEIEELKNKLNKKSVLIIDDLDRIDPEHIFRILNSFNVYLGLDQEDYKRNKSLFGFDKIIFVGDVRNIKSIFYHKYGLKADFYGYFSRFYRYVYEFNWWMSAAYLASWFVDELNKNLNVEIVQYFLEDPENFRKYFIESEISKSILRIIIYHWFTLPEDYLTLRVCDRIRNDINTLLKDFLGIGRFKFLEHITGLNSFELECEIFFPLYILIKLAGGGKNLSDILKRLEKIDPNKCDPRLLDNICDIKKLIIERDYVKKDYIGVKEYVERFIKDYKNNPIEAFFKFLESLIPPSMKV